MKAKIVLMVLLFSAGSMMFTSCSKDDDDPVVENSEWIVGKWRVIAYSEYYDVPYVEIGDDVTQYYDFKEDGTFETVFDNGTHHIVEKGTYTYDSEKEKIHLNYTDGDETPIEIENKTDNTSEVAITTNYDGEIYLSSLEKWVRM